MSPSTPKIGAFVLETLTTGMYTNPLDTIREFVQNSADSIRAAEETGLIAKGEGRIEVAIDPHSRALSIRDNGVGISKELVTARLLNIGMSDKKIEKDAGFRGIGRLAAVAYCRTLQFKTSVKGEDTSSKIEMNCLGLKKAISPSMRQVEELANVIEVNSTVHQEKHSKEQHFFEVVMEGISSPTPEFLDIQALEKYLCQVAPVEMDSQHFIFKPKISKWQRQFGINMPTVTLVIKTPETERQIFKPYKTHYKTEDGEFKFDIKDIAFYPEKPSADFPFWIWYGVTDLLGMVGDERVSGLRFRKNNIAIGGPERVAELFSAISASYYRLNAWYIGEIHVMSPDVVPNARRDGFEDNETWYNIKKELSPFIQRRRTDAYDTSQNRNVPIPKVIRAAEKIMEEASTRVGTGFVSMEEQKSILDQLKKVEEKANKVFKAQKAKNIKDINKLPPVIEELAKIRETVERENNYAVKKIKSNLDRKQRKLLSEILQILYETLDEENYKKAKSAILKKFTID